MSKKGERSVPPGLLLFKDNILYKNNLFGISSKSKWRRELSIPAGGETIFFTGCGYQFLDEAKATLSLILALDRRDLPWEKTLWVTKTLNHLGVNLGELYTKLISHSHLSGEPLRCASIVLQRIGVKFGSLFEEEPCCAAPLYYIGFQEEFAHKAIAAHQILQNKGVRKIITIVPSCTFALKNLFPTFVKGWEVEVRHFLEVVCEGIKRGVKFRLPNKVKVTYHDPCFMSRSLGLIEEPRHILRNVEGIEFVEVEYAKGEWSTCCGGGGGFEVIFPEVSHILAMNRAKELLETGASVIVTSCPGCLIQLSEGVKKLKAPEVEVVDMTQLLWRALPEE